eukprot:5049210-Pyramimonas_sp.AAC.1
MDSIGGTALALMIATVAPSSKHVEETLSTLYYATSANNIKNKPVIQMDPQEQMMTALRSAAMTRNAPGCIDGGVAARESQP